MLTIEKHVTLSPEQWEMVIEGLRNPKNSWDRSDSYTTSIENPVTGLMMETEFFLGEKDLELMSNLNHGGPVHAKYRRMMPVWVTINAPLYFWKEFDTYKVGTVANSCSTMHKIHAKEFTLDDFSHEHLIDEPYDIDTYDIMDIDLSPTGLTLARNNDNGWLAHGYHTASGNKCVEYLCPKNLLESYIIEALNANREAYLKTKDKLYWWQMIQLLPSSYNQKRTVMLGYEVLTNIYMWRRDHKLDEWHTFCDWIEELPYAELIIDECKKAHEPKVALKHLLEVCDRLKKLNESVDIRMNSDHPDAESISDIIAYIESITPQKKE